MKRLMIIGMCSLLNAYTQGQELFVQTEPASNMASHSAGFRLTERVISQSGNSRLSPEVMLGLNKNWMIHLETSFSDYYTDGLKYDGINIYAKYRFFNHDGLQSHFRIAGYGRISSVRSRSMVKEFNLEGDHSGFGGGIIITQLLHKLAISGSAGLTRPFISGLSENALQKNAYQFSLSGGYLLLPRNYTSYEQVNLNLYLEILGRVNPEIPQFAGAGKELSLAPAMQFIVSSQTRFDLGYKFKLLSDRNVMPSMWLVRLEYNIFNAW